MKLQKRSGWVLVFTMMRNKIFVLFFILLIFVNGCSNVDVNPQKEYNKCTSVCASVLEEDFVTMELCRQECREKFLENN
jgi:PBP1b-binding outer membrane lipoprotein LpoB